MRCHVILACFFLVLTTSFMSSMYAYADNNEVYQRIIKANTIKCSYYVWPPFITKDANTGALSGIAYDWVEEIGKQLAMKIEWSSEINMDAMFEGYTNGRYDMICGPLVANPARARASDFTMPIVYGSYNLYARMDNHRFDHQFERANDQEVRYASLEGDMNAILGRELFPLAEKIDTPQAGGNTNVLMDVATGKADVAAMEPATALLFMKNNLNQIRLVPGGPLRTMPLNFSIPQGEEKLKSMLNITLQTLLDIGTIDRVLKKYPEYDKTLLRMIPPYQLSTMEQ